MRVFQHSFLNRQNTDISAYKENKKAVRCALHLCFSDFRVPSLKSVREENDRRGNGSKSHRPFLVGSLSRAPWDMRGRTDTPCLVHPQSPAWVTKGEAFHIAVADSFILTALDLTFYHFIVSLGNCSISVPREVPPFFFLATVQFPFMVILYILKSI